MLQIHVVSYTVAMEVQIVQSLLLLTTLDKCRRLLSIRKTKNLKYKEVVLPEQQKTMLTTKKLDIILTAIGNLLPWEEMHRRKMTMLNQNQYMQDQVLWQLFHYQQE